MNIDVYVDWIKENKDTDFLSKYPIDKWISLSDTCRQIRHLIRNAGYTKQTVDQLNILNITKGLNSDVITQITTESNKYMSKLDNFKYKFILVSSESIECIIGKYKSTIGTTYHTQYGLGRLILTISSRCHQINETIIKSALSTITHGHISEWFRHVYNLDVREMESFISRITQHS